MPDNSTSLGLSAKNFKIFSIFAECSNFIFSRLGIYGDFRYILSSISKLIALKKLCCLISSKKYNLLAIDLSSSFLIISIKSLSMISFGNSSGLIHYKSKYSLTIDRYISCVSTKSPPKGSFPQIISYSITPIDQ
jgi:hypothetical protein